MGGKPTVLVIEADPHMRLTLGELARIEGFAVVEVSDPAQATTLLKGGLVPDAVIVSFAGTYGAAEAFVLSLDAHPQCCGVAVVGIWEPNDPEVQARCTSIISRLLSASAVADALRSALRPQ